MPTEVRTYERADAKQTWETYFRAIHDTASQDYEPDQIEAWAPQTVDLEQWHQRRIAAYTFVATLDQRVIGFCDVTATGLIDMLFVHPDVAGRGVARALIESVIEQARDMGLSRLHTHASRTARPAFERFGFVVDRANPGNAIRGRRIPNFDMHRDLS